MGPVNGALEWVDGVYVRMAYSRDPSRVEGISAFIVGRSTSGRRRRAAAERSWSVDRPEVARSHRERFTGGVYARNKVAGKLTDYINVERPPRIDSQLHSTQIRSCQLLESADGRPQRAMIFQPSVCDMMTMMMMMMMVVVVVLMMK